MSTAWHMPRPLADSVVRRLPGVLARMPRVVRGMPQRLANVVVRHMLGVLARMPR